MALSLPVVTRGPLRASCIGRFLSPTSDHVARPDGRTIVFTPIDAGDEQDVDIRARVIPHGDILEIFRVPSWVVQTQDSSEAENPQVDILVICVRLYNAVTPGKSQDQIHFKRYDPALSELVDLGFFSIPVSSVVMHEAAALTLSVCEMKGPNYGSVCFSNGRNDSVFLIDPLDCSKRSSFCVWENNSGNGKPVRSYWVTPTVLAFVQQAKYSSELKFARVKKASYHAGTRPRNHFTFKRLQNTIKLGSTGIRCVGPTSITKEYSQSDEPDRGIIIYGNVLATFKITNKSVKEENMDVLDLPAIRFQNWYLLSATGTENPVYISTSLDMIIVERNGRIKQIQNNKTALMLEHPLHSDGFFLVSTTYPSRCVAKLDLDIQQDKPHRYQLYPKLTDFTKNKVICHCFGKSKGSTFWSSCTQSVMSDTLMKSESRCSVQSSTVTSDLDPDAVVTGTWKITTDDREYLLISTDEASIVVTIAFTHGGVHLTEVDDLDWIDRNCATLSATNATQVTRENINRSDHSTFAHGCEDAIAVRSHGRYTVFQHSNAVSVFANNTRISELDLENIIVDVAITGTTLAVLTPMSVLFYCLESNEGANLLKAVDVAGAATCILLTADGHNTYVGFTDGTALEVASNSTVQLAEGPISRFYEFDAQGDKRLIASSIDGFTVLDRSSGMVQQGMSGNFSSILSLSGGGTLLTIAEGTLQAIKLGLGSTIADSFVEVPQVLGGGDIWTRLSHLFVVNHSLQLVGVSKLPDLSSWIYAVIPFTPSSYKGNTSQYFPVGNDFMLEVAYRPGPSDDEDADEDDLDDTFSVDVTVNLFRIAFSANETSVRLILISSKQTLMVGDPFEEVVVKFISETKFSIFTHSVECMLGIVDVGDGTEPPKIELGPGSAAHSYVYDDHWYNNEALKKVSVITFSGSVYSVPADSIALNKDPYPSSTSRSASLLENSEDEAVMDALQLSEADALSPKTRFAVSIQNLENKLVTELLIFDYDLKTNAITGTGSFTFPSRNLSLARVHGEMISYLEEIANTTDSLEYLKFLSPEMVVGAAVGSIYLIVDVKEEKFRSALLSIQARILQELETAQSRHQSMNKNPSLQPVDGGLLLEALDMPELNYIFEQNGINPDKLLHALRALRL